MVPFSFPEPGVWEGLLQWRLASEERSNVRAEADAEDPGRVAALHCCLYLPFLSLSLSGSQLILFTGVPIKLTQKAFEMAGGYLRRESGVTLGLSL